MSKLTFKGEIKYTEKYKDRETGGDRRVYHKIGALFEREDGSLCMNLAGGGWANVYPPKIKGEQFQEAKDAVAQTSQEEVPW